MSAFTNKVAPSDVAELVDFRVPGDKSTESMAETQREGTAAIYNILCSNRFAYLADEVGMGKTYQALALAALLWNDKPSARILFISPRENLQQKWYDDYNRFFADNYRRKQGLGDDKINSVLLGKPLHRPEKFPNLRTWARTLGMPEQIAPIVRVTSFRRPWHVDKNDLKDLHRLQEKFKSRLPTWGLKISSKLRLTEEEDKTSLVLNLAFAKALSARLQLLGDRLPYFDLVIVDEAQCLRNPCNQTNRVLFESLRGNVGKWLFMSATPAHSGPNDLPKILNHYPDCEEVVIEPTLTEDLDALQRRLKDFMVRRPRRYRTDASAGNTVGKEKYRKHDYDSWKVADKNMNALSTLAIGLVQKKLVKVLGATNNRYRVGFLSSFESLQTSLTRRNVKHYSTDRNNDANTQDFEEEPSARNPEKEAPDAKFIDRLDADFTKKFRTPLPHPKIEAVVNRVAKEAFGTREVVGGQKFLIFARRVSTVDALEQRLLLEHRKGVEERIKRVWNHSVDWSTVNENKEEEHVEEDDDEDFVLDDKEKIKDPIRKAMSNGEWLFRYRKTFRDSGRNALFFEDAWIQRICKAGGVSISEAAKKIPCEIWAESLQHASRGSSGQNHAHQARYIAVQTIRRCPNAFGLDDKSAKPWREAYERCLHEHIERPPSTSTPSSKASKVRALGLLEQPTLWGFWDQKFGDTKLSLPACGDRLDSITVESLCQRQVARTLLGRVFRLTDTLLDLYYADQNGGRSAANLAQTFVDWLASNDPSAIQLRTDCELWLAHLRLIVDSCLGGAGQTWIELAKKETWDQLRNLKSVVGITAASGGQREATRLFRTPSIPRVIVCTDTLKEGVDLHLFCDKILHYGVAWTPGDMEQRVGRVDRYFSKIERRLIVEHPLTDVRLEVGYPHVLASLERGQVERVVERQVEAEALMDSPLAVSTEKDTSFIAGAETSTRVTKRIGALYQPEFPKKGRDVVLVPESEAKKIKEHYDSWYHEFQARLECAGWKVPDLEKQVTLESVCESNRGSGGQKLDWSFDAALQRYVVTLTSPPWSTGPEFSGGVRTCTVGKTKDTETFVRLLVPTHTEGNDLEGIDQIIKVLQGHEPKPDSAAKTKWEDALADMRGTDSVWTSPYTANVTVRNAERKQTVTLEALDHGVRIEGVVATLKSLKDRQEWHSEQKEDAIRKWTQSENENLPIGYLAIQGSTRLIFGIHILFGKLTKEVRRQLITEVAWRADAWEALLTGTDQY